jgi:ABC-2 type transport system ATP-binding protein
LVTTSPPSADLVIDLKAVDKVYRATFKRNRVHALRDAALQVRRGEVFGLLGPNGAGKSTLVKVLMTVISPTRCNGTLLGKPVGDKATLARVGYLPEHHRFPDYLTGMQVLDFYAGLARVPRAVRKPRAAELLDLVGLTRWSTKRVKSYSKGMRQRLGIAQSLMNDPDLVLLDEPTDGVDPVGRRDIRNILLEQKRRGKTVFLNSHLLSELEMVCDRVAIMVQGRLWAQGTIDDLTSNDHRYDIEIGDEASPRVERIIDQALSRVLVPGTPDGHALPTGEAVRIANNTLRVAGSRVESIQPIIDALRAAGLMIRSVRPHRPSLEDLFMQAVIDPTTGQALAPGASSDGARP